MPLRLTGLYFQGEVVSVFQRDRRTPAHSLHRFLPMMVSRLVLSLKKSADARSVVEWRVDHFSRVETQPDVSRIQIAMGSIGKPAVETS